MKITITESPDGPYEPTGRLDTEIETAKGKLSANFGAEALKATSHIPIVIVHDFSKQRCNGVEQAIKQFNLVQVVDSCAIIQNN